MISIMPPGAEGVGGRAWRGALAQREVENGQRGLVHDYQRMQQSKRPGSVR